MVKKLLFSISFVCLGVLPSFAQTFSTTITSNTEARIISSIPGSNFQNSLTVTASTSSSVRKGLIQFTIPAVPSGYEYVSAKLSVYAFPYSFPYTCKIFLYRNLRAVTYSEVTWDDFSFGNSWSSSGMASTTDYESEYLSQYSNTSNANGIRDFFISSTTTPADFNAFAVPGFFNATLISPDCGGIDFDWTGGGTPPTLTMYYKLDTTTASTSTYPTPVFSTSSYVPASLYSQYSTSSPYVSGSSYTFVSPTINSNNSQGAVVFITHTSSSTPTIVWNSVAMTLYESTSSAQFPELITSVYHVPLPGSGNVVVSNINGNSIKYLYASVWDSGNLVANSDKYVVDYASSRAYVDLGNFTYSVTAVGAFHTLSGLDMFNILDNNSILTYATSTFGDFTVNSASCVASFDSCYVGYSKSINPFSYFIATGAVVGLNLYGVSTDTVFSTSTVPTFVTQVFGNKGTPDGFSQCSSLVRLGTIIDSLSCLMQNTFFWFMYLFIPAPNAYVGLQNMLFTSMNSTSSLLSVVVSIPLHFFLWTSSTTVPTYQSIGFDIPHFNNAPGYYEFRFVGTSNAFFVSIDNAIYSFLNTWFPLLIAFWIGFIGLRIFYS